MSTNSGVKKTYRINLATARTADQFKVIGKHIRVADASSANAEVQIAVGDSTPDRFETLRKNGRIKDDAGFREFFVANTAQAGEWVRVIVSDGEYDVDNPSQNIIEEIAEPVVIAGGNATCTNVDVTNAATLMLAANADRVAFSFFNTGAETVYIYQANTVTTALGYPVPSGTSFSGMAQNAWYGRTAVGTCNVRIIEETA